MIKKRSRQINGWIHCKDENVVCKIVECRLPSCLLSKKVSVLYHSNSLKIRFADFHVL